MRIANPQAWIVEARYPGLFFEPVTPEEYEEAAAIAGDVVCWVQDVIEQGKGR